MQLKNFNKSYKNTIIYIVTILFSIAFIVVGYSVSKPDLDEQNYDKSYKAKIISIEDRTEESFDYGFETLSTITIKFMAEIKNDELKGTTVEANQYIDEIIAANPKEIEVGDNIIISSLISRDGEGEEWTFLEYDRSSILIWLLISFFAMIILFGRKKGVNTIISLVLTCLAIFMVYVPSILKGNNIYLSSIVVSIFIIFMSLLTLNGANKKTLCAIVGNLGGLLIAGLLALFISNILNLTGLIDEDSMFLLMVNTENPIDLKAILWGSIVIGSLGAVMDVSMSIASALNELAENMDSKSFKTMLKSGFNIGQDAIGTMSNTLILAYIGSSLSVVLLLVVNYKNVLLLFNLEMIVFEIIQAIIGSMGILFAIPITSIFAAYIYNHNNSRRI
ncbi:MAG: YibE/F family protein [Sedimentibacter sp.]|uniref:YibE/F family protein n=1 Tax=Sedimentibacter sp. TaxID=1960295 RepID=UPI002981C8AD|nr:YibE/F family protein [Sedimentibacter sp.]MDW5298603.1 YibE/F family protein [Sedimentibacter sp.]